MKKGRFLSVPAGGGPAQWALLAFALSSRLVAVWVANDDRGVAA